MSTPASSRAAIPTYRIDLASPPRRRYAALAADFGPRMRALMTGLFDELVAQLLFAGRRPPWLQALLLRGLGGPARLCLRRVRDAEEQAEIEGLAFAARVPLHLIVALNGLLDVLLGCTSGAVPDAGLGMDPLRDLLVVLEYVDSSSEDPTRVITRSVTYVGFVGALTAVRKDLSVSLNFRPNHDYHNRNLRWHQLLVLLGRRQSIGSHIRSLMLKTSTLQVRDEGLSTDDTISEVEATSTSYLETQARALASIPSAPCYLILRDGHEAAVIEKDYDSVKSEQRQKIISSSFNIDDWIEESVDRLECVQKKWDRHVKSATTKRSRKRQTPANFTDAETSSAGKPDGTETPQISVTEVTLGKWMSEYPTVNECTHFSTIISPTVGRGRARVG
ncbi:beta subunit of N-acylethanolamine-hydrolyzing acid amidase-domain-containing protein [Xylariaceae sp. FL0804]|nr:beta subunit of N-acylethanolamine-hydrolyzing acid amidase-domain-containing protein [Xylariaceae sp. FL0804]